jgi:nicotinic acid mononucleotide adenylyltransferase
MRLARLVIVTRPGYPKPAEADLRAAGIDPDRMILCDVPTPDVESTDVRRLAEAGGSLAGLLDPRVEAYLRLRRLYARPISTPPDS